MKPYVSIGSERRVWWKCSEGHEWQAYVHNRSRGTKCPFCENLIHGQNRQYPKKAIRNITTGEEFNCADEAALKYSVSKSAIAYACRNHSICKGCYWEYKS